VSVRITPHDLEPRIPTRFAATRFEAVAKLMADFHWRTLADISIATGQPESGISARLRNGGHRVLKRRNLLDDLEFRLEVCQR